MKRLAVLVLVLLVASALMVGCGRSKRTVYVPGGKVTVASGNSPLSKEKTITTETKEGKVEVTAGAEKTITEAELGVPVYPGAKSSVEGKYESKKPGETSMTHHVLSTADSFDKVVAFYKSHLKNVKNSQVMSAGGGSTPASQMAMFQVGEGKGQMMVHIVQNPKEKRTMIQVMKTQ